MLYPGILMVVMTLFIGGRLLTTLGKIVMGCLACLAVIIVLKS